MSSVTYLEELTIAFPEQSEDPCFCGSIYCTRQISPAKQRTSYLERNVILLTAAHNPRQNSTLSQSLLNECPSWLVGWTSLMCQYETDLKSIICCADKVKFILQNLNCQQPPIQVISDPFPIFWENATKQKNRQFSSSVLQEVCTLLKRHNNQEECCRALNLITEVAQLIETHPQRNQLTRLIFLVLSEILQTLKNVKFNNEGVSLVLYFMAFTHTYFSATKYPGFEAKAFEESEFEFIKQPKNKAKLALSRQYTPQYIWGQLINWNKLELQNPQSSMAQDRRGILCYPSILLSFDNSHKTFPYQCKSREAYLNYIKNRSEIQPDISAWSYQNNFNCFGSVFFEQAYSSHLIGESYVRELCSRGQASFEDKLAYWCYVENKFNPDVDCDALINLYKIQIQRCLDPHEISHQSETQTPFSQPPIRLYKYQEKMNNSMKKIKFSEMTLVVEGFSVFDEYNTQENS